jgi:hypothetical protein
MPGRIKLCIVGKLERAMGIECSEHRNAGAFSRFPYSESDYQSASNKEIAVAGGIFC